ncbi:MAG: 4-alpha-glucanotransferase [Candidatus Nanopelagicales bacterium]
MARPPSGAVVTPELEALARAYGVSIEYWDQSGVLRRSSQDAVESVLQALGADTDDADSIAESLRARDLRDWRRTLPPVVVAVGGRYAHIWAHVPHGTSVRVWIELEDGGIVEPAQSNRWVDPREVDGRLVGEATFVVPADIPLGWHTIKAFTDEGVHESTLVVTPERLHPPALAHGERLWGLMAQIYSVRSRRSWGLGDLADLADLAAWSGHELGADFLLVNPLHASAPVVPMTPSPYLPATRRFPNPIYLRVEGIAEYAYLSGPDRKAIRRLSKSVRALTADLLDRDAVWEAKSAALDIVRRVPLTPGRQARYDAYVEGEGSGLIDFATWCALTEEFGQVWQDWPEELRHPASAEVAAWRAAHADRIERHLWMQWLLDEQMESTQEAAVEVGMRAGIIHDLAVGVGGEGADAWALQDVLASGVSVGCPPDMYNQLGQDWAQPPWLPDALADAAYIPYRDMLRTLLRHAGGIRVDHILGLFRQWWIPRGAPAADGAYVAFDHDALVGILALEAHRAGALVIGEDLGTVEPRVQEALHDRGILGTSILWFERGPGGVLKAPEHWRGDALASVTVHDLPPTAGYLSGEHVRIRGELGLLSRPLEEESSADTAATREWLDLAVQRGWLADVDGSLEDRVVALHRVVAASPARLIGIAVPDLVGDLRAQNQPGTDQEYPNWRVPLTDASGDAMALEDLPRAPLLERLVAEVRPGRDGHAAVTGQAPLG